MSTYLNSGLAGSSLGIIDEVVYLRINTEESNLCGEFKPSGFIIDILVLLKCFTLSLLKSDSFDLIDNFFVYYGVPKCYWLMQSPHYDGAYREIWLDSLPHTW